MGKSQTCATPGCERLRVEDTNFCPAHQPRPTTRRPISGRAFGIAATVLLVVVGGFFVLSSIGSSGEFEGSVTSFSAENPASLRTTVRVRNLGTEAGNWWCTVTAADPSNSYTGVDVLESTVPLGAGKSELYTASLTITNEGAGFVTNVSVSDCRGS